MLYCHMPTPVGELLLAGTTEALRLVSFPRGKQAQVPTAHWERSDSAFGEVKTQLNAYFAGELKVFDLALDIQGTEFQRTVLAELQNIPYGETRSYKDVAKRIGRPDAVRAVGAANGRNPLPIIVPCHRVVGADGGLTGFGGGLPTKRFLLDLERRHSRSPETDRSRPAATMA